MFIFLFYPLPDYLQQVTFIFYIAFECLLAVLVIDLKLQRLDRLNINQPIWGFIWELICIQIIQIHRVK